MIIERVKASEGSKFWSFMMLIKIFLRSKLVKRGTVTLLLMLGVAFPVIFCVPENPNERFVLNGLNLFKIFLFDDIIEYLDQSPHTAIKFVFYGILGTKTHC